MAALLASVAITAVAASAAAAIATAVVDDKNQIIQFICCARTDLYVSTQ